MEKSIESEKLVTSEWLEENWGNPSIRVVEVSDMRDPRIYFEGNIPGAKHLYYGEFFNEMDRMGKHRRLSHCK